MLRKFKTYNMHAGYVKFIRPKSPQLQQYIKGYYTHQADTPDFHTQIAFYQNVTSTISIYEDTQLSFEGEKVIQTHQKDTGFSTYFVAKANRYQEVEFRGCLNRVAIVFYPLGINHFVHQPISELMTQHYSLFHYFDDHFSTFLPQLYQSTTIENKRDLLDAFLLQHFFDFSEKRLTKAVHLIINEDFTNVNQLAKAVTVNRRTLLRLFKKYLGYSIEEYIAVVKFRKSLLYFQQMEKPKLTEIALESDYYDQADFNHQFKYRTDMTPSELFTKLKIMDNVLFWKTS